MLVHLLGNLEIYTSLGVLTEEKINSRLLTILAGYLLTDKKKYHRISAERLIPPNGNGYVINDTLHITTDLEQFERYWCQAKQETSVIRKVELLKKAVALYKGHILSSISDQIWVISLDAYYRVIYHKGVNELLKTLIYVEDYHDVVKCATECLMISQDNKEAYYWLVLALEELSLQDMLNEQLQNVKRIFPEDEYEEFMEKFQMERSKRNHTVSDSKSLLGKFHIGSSRNGRRRAHRH